MNYILLINKEKGYTSQDVVSKVKNFLTFLFLFLAEKNFKYKKSGTYRNFRSYGNRGITNITKQ